MKIIDILNKIANGEEVKFKIIDEQEDYYCKKDDFLRDRYNQEVDWWLDSEWLNNEVEIIEEDKKIEHINKLYDITKFYKDYPEVAKMLKDICDKQYEIIDYLKSRGDE